MATITAAMSNSHRHSNSRLPAERKQHRHTSSRNEICSDDEETDSLDCFQELSGPHGFAVEHGAVEDGDLTDISLAKGVALQSGVGSQAGCDRLSSRKSLASRIANDETNNKGASFGEEDDCTTVTLSITSSSNGGSNKSSSRGSADAARRRISVANSLAARLARRTAMASFEADSSSPMPIVFDSQPQNEPISPLATPSPTDHRTARKVAHGQPETLPPLKQFGARTDAPPNPNASMQMRSLEAIVARKNAGPRWGQWWTARGHDGEGGATQTKSEEHHGGGGTLQDDAGGSPPAPGNVVREAGGSEHQPPVHHHRGRLSTGSGAGFDGNATTGDGDDDDEGGSRNGSVQNETKQRRSWKNRFSFRSSQLDSMLDRDYEDPYLDSISLGSESTSSSSGAGGPGSTGSFSLESADPTEASVDSARAAARRSAANEKVNQRRRRWSRLWRAQEFSRDAPTVHVI